VRILILARQPSPTVFEIGRQSLLTMILVGSSEPIALLIGIDPTYATLAGVAVALHGTNDVVDYIKSIIKVLLPEKLKDAVERVEAEKKLKDAEHTNADQIKRIEDNKKKEKQTDIETNLDNENS
jgi:hypothetical protein